MIATVSPVESMHGKVSGIGIGGNDDDLRDALSSMPCNLGE